MRDIDPVSIRLFLATLEEGSMARAAARENIVPSAVSKRIAEMEAQLKVPLLERGAKGAQPTPAGQALAHHARQLLQSMDRMQREMAGYVEGVRGVIKVFASVTSLSGELPADILRFRADRPQIEVDLEERTTPAIYRSVREGLADVGVASEFASHEGLQVFPYRRYALAAVLPEGHTLARARRVAYAELLDNDLVELGRDSGLSQVFDEAAREARTSRTVRARGCGIRSWRHWRRRSRARMSRRCGGSFRTWRRARSASIRPRCRRRRCARRWRPGGRTSCRCSRVGSRLAGG